MLDNLEKGKLNALFGWGSDEHQFTAHATEVGAVVHASDFATNLPLFSNLPPAKLKSRTIPAYKMKPGTKTHTVSFIMSDGDNIQLLQHDDFIGNAHFGNPDRGKTAVGWSYSPAMAVLMPNILEWVHNDLTKNDSLSTGPSGIGYSYPALFPTKEQQVGV